jgi:hypothetical protein
MVYDLIVEGQLMASKPTAAECSAGAIQHCSQDTSMTGELTFNSNSVVALRQRRTQAAVEQPNQTTSSSSQGKQHGKGVQNGLDASNGNHTTSCSSSSSSRQLEASTLRRFVGMQATFAVSAAWHLLLFFAVTGTFGWRWMWFFVAQGPLLLLEARIGQAFKAAGVCVPRVLAIILTNLLLTVMADPLLITPVVESGVVDGCFRQAHMVAAGALQLLGTSA